jgi:hypothetical protein
MTIALYDKVRLKTGETAFIVDIYGDGEAFEADIERGTDTVTDTVQLSDIAEIIN